MLDLYLFLLLTTNLYVCWPRGLPLLDDRALVQLKVTRAAVDVTHDEVVLTAVEPQPPAGAERRTAGRRPEGDSPIHCQDIHSGCIGNIVQWVVQHLTYDDAYQRTCLTVVMAFRLNMFRLLIRRL